MNVLVIGQGGREHALVRALLRSPSVDRVEALPGSDGMEREIHCHRQLSALDFSSVTQVVKRQSIDLVVVGPEVPLAHGLADYLRAQNVLVFGPSQSGARLEASKIFSKEFMLRAEVPTSRFAVVRSVAETLQQARQFAPPYVLKADGLAAGKGVVICATLAELERAAEQFFVARVLGDAGSAALLEEFAQGYELSYLVLTNGERYVKLPLSQDHKRLGDGDAGPNTGGMGVVAPMAIAAELDAQIEKQVLSPVMRQMQREGMLYRGVLYVGLMITSSGPKVIEFNVRFGDPEAQAILPLVDTDWGQALQAVARGECPELPHAKGASVCVVLAAPGYPGEVQSGGVMQGLLEPLSEHSYFLHAGSKLQGEQWTVAGGRVLNAIGLGRDLSEAQERAYQQARQISWQGLQMRQDIGMKS